MEDEAHTSERAGAAPSQETRKEKTQKKGAKKRFKTEKKKCALACRRLVYSLSNVLRRVLT